MTDGALTTTPPAVTSHVRVRYAETDQMGVVYHANYFVWFEIGRTDLLRTLGGTYRDLETAGIFLPVIEASCQYMESCHYDDELTIETTGRVLSPVRLEFTYTVMRPRDGARAAAGRTVHAALNREGRPTRLPSAVRAALDDTAPPSPAAAPTALKGGATRTGGRSHERV